VWERAFANERRAAVAVWWEALTIIRRYPLAAVVPAVLLGALGGSPYYIKEGTLNISEEIITSFTGALAFYLYLMVAEEIMIIYMAYAEEVAAEAERGSESITMGGVLRMLGRAIPLLPSIIVASVAAIALPIAATSLLVIPGLWLLTRWSLFAPVIARERVGPVAALKRSDALVEGHFELAFLTAALAIVLEEAVIHAGAVAGLAVTGSDTWGQFMGGWIATLLITPLAALATSVAYSRVSRSS
jgi:hypothetical protein